MNPKEIAKLLLDVKAVGLNLSEPFRYTSGILSPIYCDNRMIISHVDERHKIIDGFVRLVKKNKLKFDIVGGTSTAGIPYAAFLAERLGLPMVYIRGKAKEHGKKKQVEGDMKKGDHVLIVEDLISTGGSSLESVEGVRNEGGIVTDCIAIFTYEFEKAKKRFSEMNVQLHTLSNFSTLIAVAANAGYITNEEKEKALEWNKDPEGWGKTMGYE